MDWNEFIKEERKKENPSQLKAAEKLLENDVLFVGLSSQKQPVKKDGCWVGGVAGYSSEECQGYINVFTSPDTAAMWQRNYSRPVGVLYRENGFNNLFDIATICGIENVWVNEGSEVSIIMDTHVIREAAGNDGVMFVQGFTDDGSGLMVNINDVEAQVVTFEEN